MSRILAHVIRCIRLLNDVKGAVAQLVVGQADIQATLGRMEEQLRTLVDGPDEGTITLHFSVRERPL